MEIEHRVIDVCYAPLWEPYFRQQESSKVTRTHLYLTRVVHNTAFQANGRKALRKGARAVGQVTMALFFCPDFGSILLRSHLHDL